MSRVIVIAEIGECFNGDMETARTLINVASEAGCDLVKFQTLDYENISENDPERDWFYKIALDPAKIAALTNYANAANIKIMFTPQNLTTAMWLVDAGFKDIKIASSLIKDRQMLKFISKHFQRVFVSTGMASLDEVSEVAKEMARVPELYILHCISEYPTGPLLEQRGLVALNHENVRLNMMRILMGLFPTHKIGYSDHTSGILAPIAAVAMGAQVIEKHITLDRQTPIRNFAEGGEYLGTDHVLSLEPDELKQMVKQIREVEKIVGVWEWERTEGEKILSDFLRKRFNN